MEIVGEHRGYIEHVYIVKLSSLRRYSYRVVLPTYLSRKVRTQSGFCFQNRMQYHERRRDVILHLNSQNQIPRNSYHEDGKADNAKWLTVLANIFVTPSHETA